MNSSKVNISVETVSYPNSRLKNIKDKRAEKNSIFQEDINNTELAGDLGHFENIKVDKAREIIHIAENSDYKGKLPEYTDDVSIRVKSAVITALSNLYEGKSDSERKRGYEFNIACTIEEIKGIKNDTSLSNEEKNFRIKYFNDKMNAIKELYKRAGGKKESLLEKLGKNLLSGIIDSTTGANNGNKIVESIFEQSGDNLKVLNIDNIKVYSLEEQPHGSDQLMQGCDTRLDEYVENSEFINSINTKAQANKEKSIQDINNYIEYLKANGNLGKTSKQIEEEYCASQKHINGISNNVQQNCDDKLKNDIKNKFQKQIMNEMKNAKIKTQELQAGFLMLEKKSCESDIKVIKEEIENRKNKQAANEKFNDWSDEKLENAKKILGEKIEVINELYREIIPNWWDENSPKVFACIIAIGATLSDDKKEQNEKKHNIINFEIPM